MLTLSLSEETSDGAGGIAAAVGATTSFINVTNADFNIYTQIVDGTHAPRAADNGLKREITWAAQIV